MRKFAPNLKTGGKTTIFVIGVPYVHTNFYYKRRLPQVVYNTNPPPSTLSVPNPASSPFFSTLLQNYLSPISSMTMMNGPQQNIPAYVACAHQSCSP